jgi:hypothetical protein
MPLVSLFRLLMGMFSAGNLSRQFVDRAQRGCVHRASLSYYIEDFWDLRPEHGSGAQPSASGLQRTPARLQAADVRRQGATVAVLGIAL